MRSIYVFKVLENNVPIYIMISVSLISNKLFKNEKVNFFDCFLVNENILFKTLSSQLFSRKT